MKVNSEVFRAYDIRGIVDEELTPKLVENIGKAIGSEVLERKAKDIYVGRDGRLSGKEIRLFNSRHLKNRMQCDWYWNGSHPAFVFCNF